MVAPAGPEWPGTGIGAVRRGSVGRVTSPVQHEETDRLTRRLSRVAELLHGVNYYAPEINRLADDGFNGWWHAYLAYRSAPMGPVQAPVVTATFYNFAPAMVERAIPGVWEIMTPEEVLARRDELVAEALDRIFADTADSGPGHGAIIAEAADLVREAVGDLPPQGRVLSAALGRLPWPDRPIMGLWHGCTIWREFRGDGHNIALAAAEIDGVESHLLMAAHGHGNQQTITGIRGWTDEEWMAAAQRLRGRGLLDEHGRYTEHGRSFRSEVERRTDRLSAAPVLNLGMARASRLHELLGVLGAHLTETGEVPGVWPPPAVRK